MCVLTPGQYPNHRRREVDDSIRRGTKFVTKVQREDGSWYGSWAICFTYGTWFGVECMMATGADPESAPVLKAMRFLLDHQNADGGWGESYLSCVTRKYSKNVKEGCVCVVINCLLTSI